MFISNDHAFEQVILLVLLVLFVIRLHVVRKWKVLKELNIPHDPPTFLGLGNMRRYFKSSDAFFTDDLKMKKKYGYVYGSYFGTSPRITISDPKILRRIFISDFSNFKDRRKSLTKVNGKEMNSALTTASGQQWKRIRDTLSPNFSTCKLKGRMDSIEKCADKMVGQLQKASVEKGGRFSTEKVFGRLSMDMICSAGFSINIHNQGGEEKAEVVMAKNLFDRGFLTNPFVPLFTLLPWTEKIAETLNYSVLKKDVLGFYKRLIDVLIKTRKSCVAKTRDDIITRMLKHEITEEEASKGKTKGITRGEIVGNSVMMISGYETTANTMSFFSYCLSVRKDVQQKLVEEIQNAVEIFGGFTYDAINSMKYLDMCMKESQRLYGIVPRNSRFCEKDITINDIKIPAGSHIDIPIYAMSHDEEYWQDPWEYKPERFENTSKIDPMIFQPFGVGPRNCIGMRFAIMEVKMAICKILQHFVLDVCEDTPGPPLQMTFSVSMTPKEKLFLKVLTRT